MGNESATQRNVKILYSTGRRKEVLSRLRET